MEEETKVKENNTKKVEFSPKGKKQKVCSFCQSKKDPTFTDSVTLKRFISDRSRIYPKSKTFFCSKHQRMTTKQIKYARHLALLPFITRV